MSAQRPTTVAVSRTLTHAELPIRALDFVPSVRQSVRVTLVLLMLLAMYVAGLLVFLSIASLVARECWRRLPPTRG